MTGKRINSIDLIKAIAILCVLVFHFCYPITGDNSLRRLGLIGVSLFFMASGFILSSKYSEIGFSIKWFFKRYIKIASIYYPALILIVILFWKQCYSGNLFYNFLSHFLFIDSFYADYNYGIISPAWFLAPLIALYFLFPFLNKLIKKYWFSFIPLMLVMVFFRVHIEKYTDVSPFFFIGDFCFGIAFAYGKKIWLLIFSFLVCFVQPFMIIPYVLFYVLFFTNFENKFISVVSSNTILLFLFHEGLFNILFGKWKIYGFNKIISAIIFVLSLIIFVYLTHLISKKIGNKNHK